MGSHQGYFKNVLFAAHEFEVNLKNALDLSRDNEDWDRLNTIIVKTEDVLLQAKIEIQKRHPTSRSIFADKPESPASTFPATSLSEPRLDGPRGYDQNDAAKGSSSSHHANANNSRNQQQVNRTHNQRAETHKPPTKLNNQTNKNSHSDGFRNTTDAKTGQAHEIDPLGIFLPGLSLRTTENDLRAKFSTYGSISGIRILRKGPENIPTGKGIIWFVSADTVQTLLHQTFLVDGAEVKVTPLHKKANFNKPNPPVHRANNFSDVPIKAPRTGATSQMSDQSTQNNDGKCLVCKSKIDCIVLWCGHSILCSDCAGKISVCPKCGEVVSKITKLN